MVELVEGDVVGQVDGDGVGQVDGDGVGGDGVGVEEGDEDGVGVEEGDEDGGGVVVEQEGEGEMEGQSHDKVGVVELGEGKENTPVWGGFLGSERLSGVVGGVSGSGSAGWSGSWGLSFENPSKNQHRSRGAGIPTSSFPVLI